MPARKIVSLIEVVAAFAHSATPVATGRSDSNSPLSTQAAVERCHGRLFVVQIMHYPTPFELWQRCGADDGAPG